MAQDLSGVVTVCNKCGHELPLALEDQVAPEDVVTHNSVCVNCGEGTYSQHEDRLALQIRKLQKVQAERSGTHTEVAVAEEGDVSDVANEVKA